MITQESASTQINSNKELLSTELCIAADHPKTRFSGSLVTPTVGCLAFFHDPVFHRSYHIIRRTPVAQSAAEGPTIPPGYRLSAYEATYPSDWFDVLTEQAFPSFMGRDGKDVVSSGSWSSNRTDDVDVDRQAFDIQRARLWGARVWWGEGDQRFDIIADLSFLTFLGSADWLAGMFGLSAGSYSVFVDPDSIPASLFRSGQLEEGPDVAYILDEGKIAAVRATPHPC